jgi:hypothetical protein
MVAGQVLPWAATVVVFFAGYQGGGRSVKHGPVRQRYQFFHLFCFGFCWLLKVNVKQT